MSICWVNKKGAGRLDMKNAGVKTSSSFVWTLVVKKKNISGGPKTDLLGQSKKGARRLDMKNARVNKLSSFVWTLVVKKENETG